MWENIQEFGTPWGFEIKQRIEFAYRSLVQLEINIRVFSYSNTKYKKRRLTGEKAIDIFGNGAEHIFEY